MVVLCAWGLLCWLGWLGLWFDCGGFLGGLGVDVSDLRCWMWSVCELLVRYGVWIWFMLWF